MYVRTLIAVVALCGWLVAALVAFVIVALVSFFGVGLIGVFIAFVSTQVELESGGMAGGAYGASMIQHQVKVERDLSSEQRAASRHEHSLAVESARFFKHFGLGLALIGFAGFAYSYL